MCDTITIAIAITCFPQCPACSIRVKIVGDNIDKTVKARYMRTGSHRNQSLHYFHSLALRSRIDFSHLPNVYPDTCSPSPLKLAESLLPSASDDQSLRDLFIMHVSRVLSTHIPFFEFAFEDVVEWHRKHDYYKQMSSESVVVSSNKFQSACD